MKQEVLNMINCTNESINKILENNTKIHIQRIDLRKKEMEINEGLTEKVIIFLFFFKKDFE